MRTLPPLKFGILAAFLLANSALDAASPDWKFLYEKDGFKAFEYQGAPVAYRAEGTVDVDILELAAVLVDVPRRTEWVSHLVENRLLEGDPQGHQIAYSRYDLPWPVQDRDAVIESTVELDETRGWVRVQFWNVRSAAAPERRDCLRVPLSEGDFTLEDTGHGAVRVTYTIRLDPGGWLPDWVVRIFVRDAPATTLRAFKAQVLKTRGQYEDFLAPYRARRAKGRNASD